MDPAARRRQILDATFELAAEGGFADVTIDRVARRAGITRPVVYDVFGGLTGLLDALVDDAEARALAAVKAALPDLAGDPRPDEVLERAVTAFLESAAAEPTLWRVVLAPAESTPPEIRARYRAHRVAITARVAEILDWWVGQVPALRELDTAIMARTLIAVFEDATRLALHDPDRYPVRKLAAEAAVLARLVAVAP